MALNNSPVIIGRHQRGPNVLEIKYHPDSGAFYTLNGIDTPVDISKPIGAFIGEVVGVFWDDNDEEQS